MATDSRNNVIVVAFPFLRKYNSAGELIGERLINFGQPRQLRLDVDRGDSIIVAGRHLYYDSVWVIQKWFGPNTPLWEREIVFSRDTLLPPRFSDIAIDNQNFILITGFNSETYYGRWVTYKLRPDGTIKWKKIFTSNWGPDMNTFVCADDSLNVIVGGVRGVYPVPRSWYPQVYKYSPTGDSLWAVCYFDSFPGNYAIGELTADRWGNVILPGVKMGTPFLFKYDQQGNPLWTWFDTISCEIHSCVTDTGGNIYTAGARKLPDVVDVEVRKFLPNGQLVWIFSYPLGPGHASEYFCFKIDLDREGDILVAAHKDTIVYIFKITDRSGISEERSKKLMPNHTFITIINSNQKHKIILPFDATSIEIYDISGKLKKREKLNKKEYIWLSQDEKGKPFSQGVYFLKACGKEKEAIKKIVLLR
jgi:hypothetical protein